MRHYKLCLVTLSFALVCTLDSSLTHAQAIKGLVPPDPAPKEPVTDRLEREGDEFPEEKIILDEEAPALKLTRRNPTFAPEESIAKILDVKTNEIIIQPKDQRDSVELVLTEDAVVTLNHQPAKLSDLKAGDYVLVSDRVAQSGMISKLDVGRAPHVGNSPKATNSQANRTESEDLLTKGERAALGVVISDSPGLGVLIVKVNQDTPAWLAGLSAGDYLMRMDAQSIKTPEDYLAILQDHDPRGSVKLTVWREGKTFSGTSELMSATNARDMVVDNGFALLTQSPSETRGSRLTTFEVETRKPVTVENVDGSVTEIVTDDDINVQSYGELIQEHRKIQQRLKRLNEQLERLKKEDQ